MVHLDFVFGMNERWEGETILMFCNIEDLLLFFHVKASGCALVMTRLGF